MKINILTRTSLLLALTICIQIIRLPAPITGPLVNFLLVLATILLGVSSGVFIGSLSPWLALIFGILPAPLYPAVPFIMAGNIMYCFLAGQFYRLHWCWGGLLGVAAGSLAKFLIIGVAAKVLLEFPAPLAALLFWPQLVNALLGGVVALFLMTRLRRITAGSAAEKPLEEEKQ